MAKEYNSKIRIVRGITQSPDTEVQIVNKINEIMFELGTVSYTHLTLPTNREV